MVRLLLVFLGALGSVGCTGGASTGAGLQADAGPACNEVPALGPYVDRADFEGPGPLPEGGEIVDGTYQLTAYNLYYLPASAPRIPYSVAITIVITGNVLQRVQLTENGGEARTTTTFTTDGVQFNETQTCMSGSVLSGFAGTYTATPTTLEAYAFVGGLLHEKIFTKL